MTSCLFNIASVCSGEHITLTCSGNHSMSLAWNITFPDGSNQRPELRYIPSAGTATCQAPRTVQQTVFQFVRTSIAPLISTLAVYNMISALNGTRVECDDGDKISTTIIDVIGNGISTRICRLGDCCTISIKLTPQKQDILYMHAWLIFIHKLKPENW